MSNYAWNPFELEARTATPATTDIDTHDVRGAHVVINVTAISGASVVPTLRGKIERTGTYYDMLVGEAITTTGVRVLKIHPDLMPIVNKTTKDVLPEWINMLMTHADANSITYEVDILGVN